MIDYTPWLHKSNVTRSFEITLNSQQGRKTKNSKPKIQSQKTHKVLT